ncbi:MAG: hypothetical protein PHN74_00580 [Candidatus Pacebacteria bacterium]|nr:hypothetical protein [Candidatus Paceibacterota bacterium]
MFSNGKLVEMLKRARVDLRILEDKRIFIKTRLETAYRTGELAEKIKARDALGVVRNGINIKAAEIRGIKRAMRGKSEIPFVDEVNFKIRLSESIASMGIEDARRKMEQKRIGKPAVDETVFKKRLSESIASLD